MTETTVVVNFWGALVAVAVPTVTALAAYWKSKQTAKLSAERAAKIAAELTAKHVLDEQTRIINTAVETANRHIEDLRYMVRSLMIKAGLAERPLTAKERKTDKL